MTNRKVLKDLHQGLARCVTTMLNIALVSSVLHSRINFSESYKIYCTVVRVKYIFQAISTKTVRPD